MKTIYRRIILGAAVAALVCSCIGERHSTSDGQQSVDQYVTLNVTLPEQVGTRLGTRATAADFLGLDDLNIVIAEGSDNDDAILSCVWFDVAAARGGAPIEGGEVEYSGDGSDFHIHFSKEWIEQMEIPLTGAYFLVGNYGGRLDALADVGDLRSLRDTNPDMAGWINVQRPLMYAETVADPASDHPFHEGHYGGRSLKGALRRTSAMISLKIDGTDLDPGVVITPVSVALHNVPTGCVLGGDTSVATEFGGLTPQPGAVAADGEWLDAVGDLHWPRIVGSATTNVADAVNAVGRHYSDSPASIGDPDYSDPEVRPLFMYENIHGAGFGADNDDAKHKRPRDVARTKEAIEAASATCSYLEVRAQYQKMEGNNAVMGGSVSFRVFLGGDLTQNFDVERNSYHAITLFLSGAAVSEGGQFYEDGELKTDPEAVTWRVESNLARDVFVSDSDYMLNGTGRMIFIEQLNESNQGEPTFDIILRNGWNDAGGQPFVFIDWIDGWLPLDYRGAAKEGEVRDNGRGNREFRLYVQPMIRGVTWFGAGNSRSVSFRIEQFTGNNGVSSDFFTITQYEPIPVTIDADSPQRVRDYVTNVLGRSLPFSMLIDRIDRDAMPWGFDGVRLNANPAATGIENVYHMQTVGSAGEDNHQIAARNYLPFGRSLRVGSGANVTFDNTRGSAMMHAALIHRFQRYGSGAPTQRTAAIIADTDFPPRPYVGEDGLMFEFSIPSIEEWQLLELLNEEQGIFDSAHPVVPWTDYWTSQAVEGNSHAYVYQTGRNLIGADRAAWPLQFTADRSIGMRSRFVYTKPTRIPDVR
jgi:hypothetical protein